MDYKKLAALIFEEVGGKENIKSAIHCVTRLRFDLKNFDIPNTEKIKNIEGVLSVVIQGGQYQVVIGPTVGNVHAELQLLLDGTTVTATSKTEMQETKKSLFDRFSDTISGIFVPILGALIVIGLVKATLALFAALNLISPESGTYKILYVMCDAFFYYFPVIVAFSAGKKFGVNPYFSAVFGCILVHPDLVAMFNEGITLHFFGIPVVMANYISSVFPVIIAIWVVAKLQKLIKKLCNGRLTLESYLSQLIPFLVVAPLTLIVIGPIIVRASDLLIGSFMWLLALNPIVCGLIIGGLSQIIVIFGLHWGLIPVYINNLMTLGYDPVGALTVPGTFGQTGAALGMALATKDKKQKNLGFSTILPGLMGVTEPIIYGITLPKKELFAIACISSGIGGAIAGMSASYMYTFGPVGVFGIITFVNPNKGLDLGFFGMCIAMVVSLVISTIMTFLYIKYKEKAINSI